MRTRAALSALLLSSSLLAATPTGPDIHDTRLLSEPAISADRIAFIYAGDLWTSDVQGRNVRRVTADVGAESSPAFSPDGKWIAFSAQYEGNIDVYVVSADGGVPRRLTWHPGADVVQGFTADGSAVLFTSNRAVYTTRYRQLFTVPVGGGMEQQLPIPNADRGSISPDGKRIAYNPLGAQYRQWKRYRGGSVSRVWIYDVASHAIEKVPQPNTRSNDAAPMWIGDTVYFLSDRDGEFNLYSYDAKGKSVARLTNHTDFPILNATSGAGRIVYEQAGWIHVFDPKARSSARVPIGVAADLQETRPRFVKGVKYVRRASLSPSGARLAVEFRGEILSVPAEKGDVRNLTNTTGAHERWPIWSPDGRRIAYFSDESGEYELIRPQPGRQGTAGRGSSCRAPGSTTAPVWSPDSKKIAYTDNSWTIWWIDLATGASKKIGSEYLYGPQKTIWPAWSPDSRWIAYTLANKTYIQTLYVYSLERRQVLRDHRRHERRLGARVRPQRQVPLLPRLDERGPPAQLVLARDRRAARHQVDLHGGAPQGPPVAARQRRATRRSSRPKRNARRRREKEKDKKGVWGSIDDEPAKAADKADKPSDKDKPGEEKPRTPPAAERVTIDRDGIDFRILDLPIPTADLVEISRRVRPARSSSCARPTRRAPCSGSTSRTARPRRSCPTSTATRSPRTRRSSSTA